MRIYLAPMEGVVDALTRDLLTRVGGVDRCVTEFIRVTDHVLPRRVFLRDCPELAHGSRTPAGTPVFVQLLGSEPAVLADNAAKAAALGAAGIDLNFGCPAKTVNRHRGGACLLQETALLERIVAQVRRAVPRSTPVTVKIRLGYGDHRPALDNALAALAGGADELVVHARSKVDGYRPPAYWEKVAALREALSIPVIINGEIWTPEEAHRARQLSGCHDMMLGRGLLSRPDLARRCRGEDLHWAWPEVVALLTAFAEASTGRYPPRTLANRLKQWLLYLTRGFAEAEALFPTLKRLRDPQALLTALTPPAWPAPPSIAETPAAHP